MSVPVRVPLPRLSLEELLQLKWLLGGGLTLLSASTVLYLEIEAWALLAILAAVVLAGLWRPDWIARVPRWVHRLSFPAIVTVFTLDIWLTGEVLAATVRLDLLLLIYRSITYRQRRDDLQVIVLGLFLIVLAGVLTVSLTFAVQILAFTAGSLAFLVAITLAHTLATEPAAGVATPESGAPGWARHVHWFDLLRRVRQVIRWRVVAFGAVLFAGLVVISAVLFMAIPRFQLENGLFLERFVTRKARTGFSDTIRFGDLTEITEDNGVALNVDVSDRSRIPAAPYWRMVVLDEYRDGIFRLSAMSRRGFGREHTGQYLRGLRPRREAADVSWTFYLESGVSRFLPLLSRFGGLRFQDPQNFRFAAATSLVALRVDPVTMLAYRVEGMLPEASLPDPAFALEWRAYGNDRRFAGPLLLDVDLREADRAELSRIAQQLTAGTAGGAPVFAKAAMAWLAGHHAYTLQPKVPGGPGDPLVRWLRSNAAGHCELFAGSLVLLARTAGWPARVVTGFRGGSWNAYSNNFTLRNSDAHAWCEIFDPATGAWFRADPTPGAGAAAGDDTPGEATLKRRLDRSWAARLESLRVFWYRRIVNFDQQSQLDALRSLKENSAATGRRLRAFIAGWNERFQQWRRTPWSYGRAVGWLAAAAAAGLAGWLLWRSRFRLIGRWGRRSRRMDPVRREAGRWLVQLSERRPPDDATRRLALDAVIRDLQRLRFGARETWRPPAGVFRAARRLSRTLPRRRRSEDAVPAGGPPAP